MTNLTGVALDRRLDAELAELDAFFMGNSKIHDAARRLAERLDDAKVDYAIAGAIALGVHGFRRATEDLDVLITREGLERFKSSWLGRGYVNLRPGGKAIRDTASNVKIDFLIAGDYPGDGKPKPVAFPDPASAAIRGQRFRVLPLERLVELKLASAMTAPHRGRDFFDIVDLFRRGVVSQDMRDALDPYVREKFDEADRLARAAEDDDY